jgi:hypothetical protein
LNALAQENKKMKDQLARYQASQPGRKKKDADSVKTALKGPNTLNYFQVILNLGKSFAVLEYPWLDRTSFRKANSFPLFPLPDIFRTGRPSPHWPAQLTATLYQHIPEKYHQLVNADDFSDFADNVSLGALGFTIKVI